MNRAAIVGVLATLTLGACAGHPAAPTGPSLGRPSAARAGAPAPSPLVTLPLPGRTLELWPFTGFGFGQQSDPVNLVWTGHADPRALRAALLSLDGDRTAFGFPAVFPFNCTWHDEPEVQPEVAYTAASGWVGSPIMLECGTYDQARFHLRFFDVGGVTVGGAPFEVLIPGTLDHQTISWKLAEQFVVVDFLRTGLLDPGAPLTAHRSWVQQFDQVIPQPFCAPGPNAFLYVVGPVTLEQDVELTSAGHYVSQFRAAGRLNVTPVDPTTGRPSGATYGAVVLETHRGILTDAGTSTAPYVA